MTEVTNEYVSYTYLYGVLAVYFMLFRRLL